MKGANSVKLFGNDLQTLENTGQRVVNILASVRGIKKRRSFPHPGPAEPGDQDRPPGLRPLRGVNVADVETAIQVAIGGKAFSQMVEGEKLYDIILRLPDLAP